jgi:hypothetical protein
MGNVSAGQRAVGGRPHNCIPRLNSGESYEASHCCVRIGSMKSAIALYNLTPTGTPVTIL